VKYLLDTHILLWWFENNSKLSKKYSLFLEQVEKTEQSVGVSIISFWEIAKAIQNGRMKLDFSPEQWFEEIEEHPLIEVFPLTSRIILDSTRLGPTFHKDPGDQLIAATARCHELRLMTLDDRIIKSGIVAIA